MNSKREALSRIGIASKGVVYILIGLLTAFATFGIGESKSSTKGALNFIAEQSYGKFLLFIIGIGLLGYLFFNAYQAFKNLKNHEKDTKGYILRGSYFISGLVYGLLGFTALKMAFGYTTSTSSRVVYILNSDYGNIIAIVIGFALVGKAIYELYMAYSGKFKEEVEHTSIDAKAKGVLTKAGKIGFTARGIVAGILAFLFFKAGFKNTSDQINRTDAFNVLQDQFGSIIVAIVALGLVCYGIFMLIKSKYPDVNLQ